MKQVGVDICNLPETNEYCHVGEIEDENQEPFDLEYFDAVFKSATKVRTSIKDDAAENMKAAQKKQKHDYDRRHV